MHKVCYPLKIKKMPPPLNIFSSNLHESQVPPLANSGGTCPLFLPGSATGLDRFCMKKRLLDKKSDSS